MPGAEFQQRGGANMPRGRERVLDEGKQREVCAFVRRVPLRVFESHTTKEPPPSRETRSRISQLPVPIWQESPAHPDLGCHSCSCQIGDRRAGHFVARRATQKFSTSCDSRFCRRRCPFEIGTADAFSITDSQSKRGPVSLRAVLAFPDVVTCPAPRCTVAGSELRYPWLPAGTVICIGLILLPSGQFFGVLRP